MLIYFTIEANQHSFARHITLKMPISQGKVLIFMRDSFNFRVVKVQPNESCHEVKIPYT